MWFLILFFLIAFLFLFPYIKRAFERGGFVRRLKKECLLKKYKLKKMSLFSLYFCNFSDNFDIEIDTGKSLYAVKLWDDAQRSSNTIFAQGGRVYKRRKVVDVFGEDGKRTHSVVESKLGVLNISKQNQKSDKYTQKYLLLDKTENLYKYDGKEICRIKKGDDVYGMSVCLRSDFLTDIFGKKSISVIAEK